MHCRNCGYNMDPQAVVCVHCGVPTGVGGNFCHHCGQSTEKDAAFCTHCGVALPKQYKTPQAPQAPQAPGVPGRKSRLAAGLLGIFVGGLGIHNFYLGFNSRAVAQLLITVLSCGFLAPVSAIWGLVEGILILTGERNEDAWGNPISD